MNAEQIANTNFKYQFSFLLAFGIENPYPVFLIIF